MEIIVSKKNIDKKYLDKFNIKTNQSTGEMTVETNSGKKYTITGDQDDIGIVYKMNGKEFDSVNDALETINEGYYLDNTRKEALKNKALSGKLSKEEIIAKLKTIGFGASKANELASKWYTEGQATKAKKEEEAAKLKAWREKINQKVLSTEKTSNKKGDMADAFVKAWNNKNLGVKAVKEELVTEDTKADFRSAILKAAEDKEMTTPGHVLHYLEQKGKVPSEYFGRTTKAMQFIIDTITSYGGHYASANPKLMKYIDSMSVNESERFGY